VSSYTKSVGRALRILQSFSADRTALALTEIVKLVGVDKATARRLLVTMQQHGFVDQDPATRQYLLGPVVVELGAAVRLKQGLAEVVRPVMYQAAKLTGMTAYLGVLYGHEAICLERIEGRSPVELRLWTRGSRLPLNCGSAPRILLAHLSEAEIRDIVTHHTRRITPKSQTSPRVLLRTLAEIRARGWELTVDDVARDAAALGVPIRDRTGEVVAAMSVGGLTHQLLDGRRPRYVKELQALAARLSPRIPSSNGA